MLTQLLNRPCVITRNLPSSDINDYGDEVPTESLVETVCELQQQQRAEPGDEGEMSVTRWLLILPAGTDVRSSDTIEVDGEVYQFVGDPWSARNPRTRTESHVEATVVRAAGGEELS